MHPVEDIGISPWLVDVVEFGADAYAHRKQMNVKQLYNQVPQTAWVGQFGSVRVPVAVGVSWEQDTSVRISLQTGLAALSDPRLAAQPGRERSAAMVRRTLGQYVAVCPRLQLTSHTQPTSTLSNKVWKVYFYKEVCSIVHCVRHYVWLSSAYMYMYGCDYTA